jgi:hypothetical protein
MFSTLPTKAGNSEPIQVQLSLVTRRSPVILDHQLDLQGLFATFIEQYCPRGAKSVPRYHCDSQHISEVKSQAASVRT